jgi:hypothetical protein
MKTGTWLANIEHGVSLLSSAYNKLGTSFWAEQQKTWFTNWSIHVDPGKGGEVSHPRNL